MSDDDEDAPDCPRCHNAVSIPFGLERPEHGLCWLCATDRVTELESALRRVAELKHHQDCYYFFRRAIDPECDCHVAIAREALK